MHILEFLNNELLSHIEILELLSRTVFLPFFTLVFVLLTPLLINLKLRMVDIYGESIGNLFTSQFKLPFLVCMVAVGLFLNVIAAELQALYNYYSFAYLGVFFFQLLIFVYVLVKVIFFIDRIYALDRGQLYKLNVTWLAEDKHYARNTHTSFIVSDINEREYSRPIKPFTDLIESCGWKLETYGHHLTRIVIENADEKSLGIFIQCWLVDFIKKSRHIDKNIGVFYEFLKLLIIHRKLESFDIASDLIGHSVLMSNTKESSNPYERIKMCFYSAMSYALYKRRYDFITVFFCNYPLHEAEETVSDYLIPKNFNAAITLYSSNKYGFVHWLAGAENNKKYDDAYFIVILCWLLHNDKGDGFQDVSNHKKSQRLRDILAENSFYLTLVRAALTQLGIPPQKQESFLKKIHSCFTQATDET